MLKPKFSLLAAVALLSACTEARIGVPAEIANGTEQLPLTGIGGWQTGHFRLGASQGSFSRRAEQSRMFGFITDRGVARFTAAGPELGGEASGDCGFAQGEVETGAVTVSTHRLQYRCVFSDGAQMHLAEVPLGTGVLAGVSRAGEIRNGGAVVQIHAIHAGPGLAVPSGSPLGYNFMVDGRQIGAVNLNGSKTIYAPRQAGPERDAVLKASLALALFWDPGA